MIKKITLLSLVVIVILLILNLFLFVQSQNLNKKINALQKIKLQLMAEKIPDGWDEYLDDKYKFKIWYPKTFSFNGITNKTRMGWLKNEKEAITGFSVHASSGTSIGLLQISIYKSDLNLQDHVKKEAGEIINDFPKIKAQNKDTESYITKTKSNGLDLYKFEIPTEYFTRYYFKKNNEVFALVPTSASFDSTPGLEQTVDQMVQSFKFIE